MIHDIHGLQFQYPPHRPELHLSRAHRVQPQQEIPVDPVGESGVSAAEDRKRLFRDFFRRDAFCFNAVDDLAEALCVAGVELCFFAEPLKRVCRGGKHSGSDGSGADDRDGDPEELKLHSQ